MKSIPSCAARVKAVLNNNVPKKVVKYEVEPFFVSVVELKERIDKWKQQKDEQKK